METTLYKKIDNELHYWEAWKTKGEQGLVHWGKVGEEGQDKEVDFQEIILVEVLEKIEDGYSRIEAKDQSVLLIQYKIDRMGTGVDLNKRSKLQAHIGEILSEVGLGSCDDGSQGNGTMNVRCLVVDVDIAKRVIEEDLFETEFDDYVRIFEEG